MTKSSLDNTTTSKMAGLVKGITNQVVMMMVMVMTTMMMMVMMMMMMVMLTMRR